MPNDMKMELRPGSIRAFLWDEAGALYGSYGFIAVTITISIPLGLMFYSIYDSLCAAGRYANFILGLF